jgi:NADH dehydrogenase [ubiquinone] 1 alpha subcomplex assembly factor 1
MLLADFDGSSPNVDPTSGPWRTVNDNIMGGRSEGGGEIRDGVMIFSGSTNTNGGGFSSIRAQERSWDLTGFDGLAALVRADGRTYVFHVFTGLRFNNGNVFYRGAFQTDALLDARGVERGEDAWQTVFVPFEDFVPMVRGRAVTGRVEPLDPAKIRGIGLMIDDGLDGPFRLEADWIRAEVRPTS